MDAVENGGSAEGCLNRVASPGAMLKDFQSITARSLVWLTCTTGVPCPEIVAAPALTVPPTGLACAGDASAATPNASARLPRNTVLAYSQHEGLLHFFMHPSSMEKKG